MGKAAPIAEVTLQLWSAGGSLPSREPHLKGLRVWNGRFLTVGQHLDWEANAIITTGMPALIQVGRCRRISGSLIGIRSEWKSPVMDACPVRLEFVYFEATWKPAWLLSRGTEFKVTFRRRRKRGNKQTS